MVLPALALSAQRPEQIVTSMQIQANKAHACFERRSPSNRFFFCRTFSPKSERAHPFQRQATVDILALDVEYAHFNNGRDLRFPAEVCIVDFDGHEIFYEYCRAGELPPSFMWRGGVKYPCIKEAASISETAERVVEIVAGKPLVGHGLQNDLNALEIQHPAELVRDTVKYPKFQRRDGTTLSLRKLAKLWLQQDIQPGSKPHSARMDAKVVMELYKHCILSDPSQLSEEEMLDGYLAQVL